MLPQCTGPRESVMCVTHILLFQVITLRLNKTKSFSGSQSLNAAAPCHEINQTKDK